MTVRTEQSKPASGHRGKQKTNKSPISGPMLGQPGRDHFKLESTIAPGDFDRPGETARSLGFDNVASAPMVRPSYHADRQARGDTCVGKSVA